MLSAANLGLEALPLTIFAGDTPLGIVNLAVKRRLAVKNCTIPHHFQYFGPIILAKPRECWATIDSYLKQHFDLAVFSLVPETESDFLGDRWCRRKRLTFRLKPAAFETLRNRCTDDVKNKLNKAARSEIEIRTTSEFPKSLYRATFARRKLRPPVDEFVLERWIGKLAEFGFTKIFLARVQGAPAAFRVQLRYGRFAYDWLAGSLEEYHRLGVNQLLMLHIGQDHFRQGLSLWDLCGGDIPTIAEFKKSFGSIPVNHYEVERWFGLKGRLYRALMKLRDRKDV